MGHQTDEEKIAPLSEQVSQEMFEGIIREVVEETGVPASSLVSKTPKMHAIYVVA